MKCPSCKNKLKVILADFEYAETYKIDKANRLSETGEKIVGEFRFFTCPECGEELTGPEFDILEIPIGDGPNS